MASKRYNAIRAKVDRAKNYPVQEALKLVKDGATAKFNESVDVSINLGIDASQTTLQDLNGRPEYLVEDNAQPLPELV